MARVTVEDCVEQVPDRAELVILASERAKSIGSGVAMTVGRDNDKNPVIALREIAAKNIHPNALRELLIAGLQNNNKIDEVQDENFHAETKDLTQGAVDYSSDDDTFSQDIGVSAVDIDLDLDHNFSKED